MIISPEGKRLHIKQNVELPENVTQLLIDSETLFASMGLGFQLRCIPCMRAGDTEHAYCAGDASADVTGDYRVFTIDCGCRIRTGVGDFVAPVAPSLPARRERLIAGEARTEAISRDQMKLIEAFETVIKKLELQYLVRCLRCQMDGRDGGVRGVAEPKDFHLTCDCTDRVYKDATSPILTH